MAAGGLPGFRFHPTEEELLDFYLSAVARGKKLHFDIIGTLDIYRHHPSELPGLATVGEREWYFFVPRDRKAGAGGRPNRTTAKGFWKATGSDRPVRSSSNPKRLLGLKKTLVFYNGRAPRGSRTDWIMNEYRLPDDDDGHHVQDIVLCKIYRKATSLKELEHRAALEDLERSKSSTSTEVMSPPTSNNNCAEAAVVPGSTDRIIKEEEVQEEAKCGGPAVQAACALPELQLPEWMQDPFLMQLRSPWQLDQQLSPYASALYF